MIVATPKYHFDGRHFNKLKKTATEDCSFKCIYALCVVLLCTFCTNCTWCYHCIMHHADPAMYVVLCAIVDSALSQFVNESPSH